MSFSRAARLKSRAALTAALQQEAEAYVELAFEAADHDLDEAQTRAAEDFDRRHTRLMSMARKSVVALEGRPASKRHLDDCVAHTRSLRWNRYVLPDQGPEHKPAVRAQLRRRAKAPRWRLEHSCNRITNLYFDEPCNDAVVSCSSASLPGGNNEPVPGEWCHSSLLRYPGIISNSELNKKMDTWAARG